VKDAKRIALLIVAIGFICFLTGLVIADISIYGVHLVDVVAVPIIVFMWIAIVGALRERRRER
jgi:uncharacterized protein with PQ loop repeat